MRKESWKQILCQNIGYLRKKNNLSRTQMAKIMGVTIKTLDSIERGVIPQRTNINLLYNLHRYFDIPMQDLLEPLEKN